MWRSVLLVSFVSLLATGIGCGPSDPREAVSGTVTLDGKPLDQGTIEFVPTAQGVLSGGVISGGKFDVPADRGLPPGTYTVRIYSADPPSGATASPDPGGGGYPMAKDRIPPKYNSESNVTAEVTAGGENHFTFEVTSQ
jgi:hypothetical protein